MHSNISSLLLAQTTLKSYSLPLFRAEMIHKIGSARCCSIQWSYSLASQSLNLTTTRINPHTNMYVEKPNNFLLFFFKPFSPHYYYTRPVSCPFLYQTQTLIPLYNISNIPSLFFLKDSLISHLTCPVCVHFLYLFFNTKPFSLFSAGLWTGDNTTSNGAFFSCT